MNITNPNSIYIPGTLKFEGYKQFNLHCFVDTGATCCIANKNVIPEEHWENAPRVISVKTANGPITINKVCKHLYINIADNLFHIPTLYQQNMDIDIILGNNFCQLYEPFIQFTDRVYFFIKEKDRKRPVMISKLKIAYFHGSTGYLESMKRRSKLAPPPPVNITPIKIEEKQRLQLLRRWEDNINQKLYIISQQHMSTIEKLLDKVCSENPIDPEKSKRWMTASIKLIDPKSVIKVKPMKYTPQDREEFGRQIAELLKMNIIIDSKSPHSSPAFLVENEAERRRGKKRMVVNYKAINKATIGDSHNLPNKDELLTLIRGKKIFSSFDCKSGFWQVFLDQESQLLTAFTCPQGHYQWRVVPFGLKQAPSIFQRHMQNAFRDFENFCCIYVDDILIYSDTEEKHQLHVAAILKRCDHLGIILSKKKAQLFKTKINFLGLEIDEGTHKPQNHILEHIHKFPNKIEDKKQLQRFLGILTYASDYIPKLAEMRKPLQAKLKKDVLWTWTDADTVYVGKIKKGLKEFPKLYHPNPEDQLIIETDASKDFWGGILKAKVKDCNNECICRYTSGSFKDSERNYHSNEQEILAVKNVINKFSGYLTPVKFIVRTDNKNFTHFLKLTHKGDYKQGRLVRWQMWFSRYDFEVEHISGESNVFADFLTREYHS